MTRFPFAPLEEKIAHNQDDETRTRTLTETLGVTRRALHFFRSDGLSIKQADKFALRAGLHPAQVWGVEWWKSNDEESA